MEENTAARWLHLRASMQRLAAVLRNASTARPLSTAAVTGFVVMSAGDAAAQLTVSSASNFDGTRNLVSSSYNGLASPCFYRWYRLMDWLIPGLAVRRLVPKVLLSQLVTTGANNPCYLSWCNSVEACLGAEPVDWAAVRTKTLEQLQRELPNLYGSSMIFWLPVTGANYALVPDHLKILFVSSCSVLWGGFVSHVAHRAAAHGAAGPGR